MTINLTPRLRLAADYLEQHGWVQRTERDENGRVCLTGAVRFCAPQNGDEHLIREVLRTRGRSEGWNDSEDRVAGDVVDLLRTAEVTDTDLADTFGPQWRGIVTLVRQAATLTDEQVLSLSAAWDAARGAARGAVNAVDAARDAARDAADAAWDAADAAWGAAWTAARDAADAAWDAADAAWDAADAAWDAADAAWDAADAAWSAVYAARDAAIAICTRDLIGTAGYRQEHFDALIGPWVSVMGMPEEATS